MVPRRNRRESRFGTAAATCGIYSTKCGGQFTTHFRTLDDAMARGHRVGDDSGCPAFGQL